MTDSRGKQVAPYGGWPTPEGIEPVAVELLGSTMSSSDCTWNSTGAVTPGLGVRCEEVHGWGRATKRG